MRLIDADALKETIDREIFRHDTTDHVFQIIDDAPSIDIEPKRGRWIVLTEDDADGYWKCSVCGTPTEAMGAHMLYNFCPFCGADMREREGE